MDRDYLRNEIKKRVISQLVNQPAYDPLKDPNAVVQLGRGQPIFNKPMTSKEWYALLMGFPDPQEFSTAVTNKIKELKSRNLTPELMNKELNDWMIKQYGDILKYINEDYFRQ